MNDRRGRVEKARRIAAGQRNLITKAQALACGFSNHEVDGFVRRGEWDRLFRGVFALAPSEPRWQQRALAVCLAGGHSVAVSHQTASAMWALDGTPQTSPAIHVSAMRRLRFRCEGLVVHQTSRRFATRRIQGIPTTSVERTLLDLSVSVSAATIELALEDALRRRLTTVDRLSRTVLEDGGKGRPGGKILKELVTRRDASRSTDSGLETKVWRALNNARLPGLVKQYPFTRSDGSGAPDRSCLSILQHRGRGGQLPVALGEKCMAP